jgi:hypothetical protein
MEEHDKKAIGLIVGIAAFITFAFLGYFSYDFFNPGAEPMPILIFVVGLFPGILLFIWFYGKQIFKGNMI